MRKFSLSEYDPDRITIVLLNGGGQHPYTKFNKITKFISKYDCNIISVELPGHGKSKFESTKTAGQMISEFSEEFTTMLEPYDRVALIGFSLGALLALKSLDYQLRHFEFVVAIGAGLIVSKAEEKIMKEYASIEFFDKMGWTKFMFDYHQDGWKQLIASLPPMLTVGSSLFVSKDFDTSSPLHIIIGDHDGVVDYSLQQEFCTHKDIQCYLLENTSHFDYFSTSWQQTSDTLSEILQPYLENIEPDN